MKKTVKAWAVFCEKSAYKPMKVELGVMYHTEKSAREGLGKCDTVVPCTITYTLPNKKHL